MPGPFQIPQDAMMSSQGPTSMGLWERIKMMNPFAGGDDIELPNESGMVDPRIPAPLAALQKAFNSANTYAGERAGGTSAIDALRRAGGR